MTNSKLGLIVVCILVAVLGSCVKADNFEAPDAIVTGSLIDSVTGQPFQSGPNDQRMYVLQTDYDKGTPIPFYWNIQPDGTFNNDKVFGATYQIYPTDGAFVPIVYTGNNGDIVDNGSQEITVKDGQTVTAKFTVAPFLEVSWVGEPKLNTDNTVTIQCKVVRGTSDPLWTFNLTDIFFYVSNTPFVSNGSYDNKLSTDVTYSGTAGNDLLGTTLTIQTKGPLNVHQGYYLRVGARTADNVNKRYNYTTVKQIEVP